MYCTVTLSKRKKIRIRQRIKKSINKVLSCFLYNERNGRRERMNEWKDQDQDQAYEEQSDELTSIAARAAQTMLLRLRPCSLFFRSMSRLEGAW